MAFCPGTPTSPKLGLLRLWGPITSSENLWLKWGPKQSCSPHQELSNDMSHATCTQVNRVNSWLLVVRSQFVNLTLGLSFGHNLCFKCPNESCKHILDIYVSINFQWYKKLLNPLSFDPWNRSLNIWESIGSRTSMWKFPWECEGSIPSHVIALPGACGMIPMLPFWPATLQPLALVVSPRLGLRHWESNWQFDSQPLKVVNFPNSLVCKWHATYNRKDID